MPGRECQRDLSAGGSKLFVLGLANMRSWSTVRKAFLARSVGSQSYRDPVLLHAIANANSAHNRHSGQAPSMWGIRRRASSGMQPARRYWPGCEIREGRVRPVAAIRPAPLAKTRPAMPQQRGQQRNGSEDNQLQQQETTHTGYRRGRRCIVGIAMCGPGPLDKTHGRHDRQ